MKNFTLLILFLGLFRFTGVGQSSPVTTLPVLSPSPSSVFTIPVTVSNFSGVMGITLNFYYNPLVISINPSSLVWNAGGSPQKTIYADPVHPGMNIFSVGWFAFSPTSLPNNSVLFSVNATFLGGSSPLNWFTDIPGFCEYSNPVGDGMPTSGEIATNGYGTYFINGSVGCPAPGGAGIISGPTTVCQNQSGVSYSITPIPDATGYVWTLPAGASILSGANTHAVSVAFGSAGGNIKVKGSNNCGNGGESTLPVTLAQPPANPGTIIGPNQVCPGQSGVSYSISPLANVSSYLWSVPNGATISSGSNSPNIQVTYPSNLLPGEITVIGLNTCGQSAQPSFLSILAGSAPGQPSGISGQASLCVGDIDQSYSITPIAGATGYVWTVPEGAVVVSGQTSNLITLSFPLALSGNLEVSGTNLCGIGAVSPPLPLLISNDPSTPEIPTGSTQAQPNSTLVYSVPEVPGAIIYQWMIIPPDAGSLSGFSSTMPVVWNNWSGYAEISVRAVSPCGQSEYSLSLMVEVSDVVGISAGDQLNFDLYPNPASSIIIIPGFPDSADWRISNPLGQGLRQGKGGLEQGLSVSSLPPGVYFLETSSYQKSSRQKFVISR